MRFSFVASVALGGILVLSLLGKLLAARPDPFPDPARPVAALAQALAKGGFATRIVRLRRAPGLLVVGRRGGCRLIAGDYPPYDTFADVYAALARPFGPLTYAYRGDVYRHPPKFYALLDFYLWRELRRMGVPRRRSAVLAVAASAACDLETIDWGTVAAVED